MFTLKIKTDNAAFEDIGKQYETAHILRGIAQRLEQGEKEGKAFDSNGNSVGEWKLK